MHTYSCDFRLQFSHTGAKRGLSDSSPVIYVAKDAQLLQVMSTKGSTLREENETRD